MRCSAALLLLGCAAVGAHAQSADPLHSRECAAARESLAVAEEDAAAKAPDAHRKLAAARREARLACLGRESGNAQRAGAPEPAVRVPPPRVEAAPQRAVVAAPPSAPLVIPRPAAITACDPGGCWDSEGRRLNQAGPLLVGPRGVCAVQGGVVQCP